MVIMAHGFGAEKAFGLSPFAERFAEEGMAVFMFDYRNFGESDGEPRDYVNPFRHIRDWEAAIEHVRGMPHVNTRKIALWGTSFAGGHVLTVAARDHGITAVATQAPFVDGIASVMNDRPGDILKSTVACLRDLLHMAAHREPYYIPAAARPGEFAVMNTEDSLEYQALIPEGAEWKNRVPARVFLFVPFYNPRLTSGRIQCPVLIVAAENDAILPLNATKRTASKIPNSQLVVLDCGHFDIYTGAYFKKNIEIQTRFLKKHLLE